jgi:hypothetical protein
MSYNVRDDNGLFGPLAGIEFTNGAGASTIVRHQGYEPVNFIQGGATGLSMANTTTTLFVAPAAGNTVLPPMGALYQVLGVSYYATANSSQPNSNIYLESTNSGTANGSGLAILAININAANSAILSTPQIQTLSTNIDNLQVWPGGRINMLTYNTTGITDLTLSVYLARTA